MNNRVIIFVMLLLLLSACADKSSEISKKIESQLNGSSTAPISLAQVGPDSWERVCILGPYTHNERAKEILGFRWDAESKTSIASSDGINVLVFIKNDEVIAYAEHPRNAGDFYKLRPSCLARDQATVLRRHSIDGWVYLLTNEQGISNHSDEKDNSDPN